MLKQLAAYARDHLETGDQIPAFYQRKPVAWVIALNPDGSPKQARLRTLKGEKEHRFGLPLPVPSVTKTSAISPSIGVDTLEYALGWVSTDPKAPSKPERVHRCHDAFVALNAAWAGADPDGPAAVIAAFFAAGHHERIAQPTAIGKDDEGNEIEMPTWARGDLVAFKVDGKYAFGHPSAQSFWRTQAEGRKGSGETGHCLLCGEAGQLLKTIPQQLPKHLVPGATQSVVLTSVNKPTHGFLGATDLRHAPICSDCGRRSTTALRSLLENAEHCAQADGAAMVWWTKEDAEIPVQYVMRAGGNEERRRRREVIEDLVLAAERGHEKAVQHAETAVDLFYSATISGNVSRLMVHDWVEMPLPAVRRNLGLWFDDIAIETWNGIIHPSIKKLAYASGRFIRTSVKKTGKAGEYAPFGATGADRPLRFETTLLHCALFGHQPPLAISQHLVSRIRRDGRVDAARAAVLRLVFNRHYERSGRMTAGLDENRHTFGYLAGRLFALYESLQRRSSNEYMQGRKDGGRTAINTTFKDRYYAGSVVNPTLGLRAGAQLSAAWAKRLRSDEKQKGYRIWVENEIERLHRLMEPEPDRGRHDQQMDFILGYHHQGQHRTVKPTDDNGEAADNDSPEGDDE